MSLRQLRDLLAVHLLAAAVVALAWTRLAPAVEYTVVGGQAFPSSELQTGRVIAGDGTFAVLAAVAGVVCAVVVLLRRVDGAGLPVGLTVGGLGGAALAWWLAVSLGPGRLSDLASAARDGDVVVPGPELRAYGVAVVWPLVAVAVAFAVTWVRGEQPPAPSGPA
jgi:hypothetical protein